MVSVAYIYIGRFTFFYLILLPLVHVSSNYLDSIKPLEIIGLSLLPYSIQSNLSAYQN